MASSDCKRIKLTPTPESRGLLQDYCFYLLPAGSLSKSRRELFGQQIKKHCGRCSDTLGSTVTHLIVDEKFNWEKICKILKSTPAQSVKVVQCMWLSECLRTNELLPCDAYELKALPPVKDQAVISEEQTEEDIGGVWKREHTNQLYTAQEDDDSDYVASDDEEDTSLQQSLESAPRKHILQMITLYEAQNDKWRVFGYQKAVSALTKYPKKVTTWEEAMAIPGIGRKLADKIWEIIESGELRKLNELSSAEDTKVLQLFNNVWGAGPQTARSWFQMGLRTLDDLKLKGNLTKQQQIGLKHYDDLLDRMPRTEAAEIETVVRNACIEFDPGLIAMACGSFRRGKSTCGDVDVLITHPDGKSHKGVFSKLLEKLTSQGFLTDDLVSQENTGNQKKYLGVCKLSGALYTKHRRLDIIVVPYDEFGCALVYFTGSAHFNRSLRHMCKKLGMSLNEHSLNVGVVRKDGEKINPGRKVPTPTEESVFKFLAVPYRPPKERDH
ncbi:DNA polymerase lambda-like isoform X2 [Tubulanus polymorphus]|uniref:DNA polymerase lambda-like isoform X2 n=1 Tax=Tubulanus polymorphus TaxID=672921 RepID=UPI003DA51753